MGAPLYIQILDLPQVFYWIKIWGFNWCSPQIHLLLFKELSSCFGSVHGVIVSHKAMAVWIDITDEWQQCPTS